MRELHVVAVSKDGRHVVLATSADASTGGFQVALDARLAAALRGELVAVGAEGPVASSVSPKQIQARLRAGETPAQIAAEAGVPVARVERFSGPVLSERAKVVEGARGVVLVRGRRGPSVVPLGEAVDHHLEHTSTVRPESVDWTARREDDGCWTVEVQWSARGRARSAGWTWDPVRRTAVPVDPPSAALGHLDAEAQAEAAAPARRTAAPASGSGATSPRSRPPSAASSRTAAGAPGRTGRAAAPTGARASSRASSPRAGTSTATGRKSATAATPAEPTSGGALAQPVTVDPAPAPRAARRAPRPAAEAGSAGRRRPAARTAPTGTSSTTTAPTGTVSTTTARTTTARTTTEPTTTARTTTEPTTTARTTTEPTTTARTTTEPTTTSASEQPSATPRRAARRTATPERMATPDRSGTRERSTTPERPAADDSAPRERRPAPGAARSVRGLRVVPDSGSPAPAGEPDSGQAAAPSPPRRTGRRASVPAWADVLLSTSPAEPVDDADHHRLPDADPRP